MSPRIPVSFAPAGITAWVDSGVTVLEAARAAGVLVSAPCGGRGVCGKCAIRVLDGELAPPDEHERRGLSAAPPGVRLACRAQVDAPVTVRPLVAGRLSDAYGAEPAQDERFVAAVDLGTSTVSAVIVGHSSGRELGRAVVANRQQVFGADVVSRISHAMGGGTHELQSAAIESVLEALEHACGKAGACLDRVERVVFAGNTVMIALLVGIDVASLAAAPFAAPEGISGEFSSAALSLALGNAELSAISPMGAMVGGDVSAGLFAAGIVAADDDCVFLDIGTNAEMVVRWDGRLFFASAAAGPAFEGWGISDGGPAVDGAIVSLSYDSNELVRSVIGDLDPAWLSGSGLVSAVALLLSLGHLNAEGVLSELGPLADRFDRDGTGVLRVNLGDVDSPVFLSQLDVRSYQTAKAAIAAGIYVLSKHARLNPGRVERFVLAGSFGSALEVGDLVATGVIPEDMAEVAVFMSGTALLGAASAAFEPSVAGGLNRLAEVAEHIELASDRLFTDSFLAATALRPFTVKRGFS